MAKAISLVAVHTHTHTHTSSLKNKKIYKIKDRSIMPAIIVG